MKRTISIASLLIFCTALGQENYQLLWEITGKKLKKPSYLFGSMHSNDSRLFQFPDSLYYAFSNAETVVLEADVSELFDGIDVRVDWNSLLILPGETANETSLSREGTQTVYGDEDGRPHFLDAWFQQTGYCGGKKFAALEKAEDQMALGVSLELSLGNTPVRNFLLSKESFIQSYLRGDIEMLTKMLHSQLAVIPGAYEALITQRNEVMAKGLDTLIRKQSVFCAIGSGHLSGKDGVIQLLRARGYNVRMVNACYSPEGSAAETKVKSWKSYTYVNDSLHFRLKLSGKPVVFETDTRLRVVFAELGQGNRYQVITGPAEKVLSDYTGDFFSGKDTEVKSGKLPDGTEYIEGLTYDENLGAIWSRIFIRGDRLFRIEACGGNKFMHSGRAHNFFDHNLLLD